MKEKYLSLIFLCLIIVAGVLPLTSAQPPFLQGEIINEGYSIKVPPFGTVPINQEFTFSFHVFNISNGYPIDNSSTNCYMHSYGRDGEHIFQGKVPHITTEINNEWEITLLPGNFSYLGDLGYLIQCNSSTSNLGGEQTVTLLVTQNGYTLESAEIVLYCIVLFVLLFFWSLCVYGSFRIPFQNIKNKDDEIIKVNWKKYLKIFCISFAYVFFVMIVWFVWNLVYAYSEWYTLSNIFHLVYRFMFAVGIPLVISIWIYSLAKLKDDSKINKFVKRMGVPYSPF